MTNTMKNPLLILNIKINDTETERIEIETLKDISDRVEEFCDIYQIRDKAVIAKMKRRVEKCVKSKYKFVEQKENAKPRIKGAKGNKKKIQRKMVKPIKVKRRKLTIDTKSHPIGITRLVHNRAASSFIEKKKVREENSKKRKEVSSFANYIKKRKKLDKLKANKVELPEEIEQDENSSKNENIDREKSNTQSQHNTITIYDVRNDRLNSLTYTNSLLLNEHNRSISLTNSQYDKPKRLEIDLNSEVSKFNRKISGRHTTKKSSFYEHYNTPQNRTLANPNSIIKLRQSKLKHELIRDDINDSILSYDTYVFKVLPKNQLKQIFSNMDANGSNLIGPRNCNLRNISAEHLKLLESVIIEIYNEDENTYFTFKDFCKLVKEHVNIE